VTGRAHAQHGQHAALQRTRAIDRAENDTNGAAGRVREVAVTGGGSVSGGDDDGGGDGGGGTARRQRRRAATPNASSPLAWLPRPGEEAPGHRGAGMSAEGRGAHTLLFTLSPRTAGARTVTFVARSATSSLMSRREVRVTRSWAWFRTEAVEQLP